jgi:hypothetical protein
MAQQWGPDPFDESADLGPAIRAALDSDNPAATLQTAFPWVPSDARRRFVLLASTREEDLDVLIERFQHTIRSHWANRYMAGDPTSQPSRWSRLFKRGEK